MHAFAGHWHLLLELQKQKPVVPQGAPTVVQLTHPPRSWTR